jgi:methylisocitrate lyase
MNEENRLNQVRPFVASSSPGLALRAVLASCKDAPLQIVGAVNAYSAILAHREGFKALYLSGGGVSASSLGVPDLGFITLADVVVDCQRIASATPLPVLVDIDTGFGETSVHIARTVQVYANLLLSLNSRSLICFQNRN